MMHIHKVSNIAKKYRSEIGRHDGVVIIFDGEISGWMNELRNPERWIPGCIAIDSHDRSFRAVGGSKYDGAKDWKEII